MTKGISVSVPFYVGTFVTRSQLLASYAKGELMFLFPSMSGPS